jgi:Fe-S-cluster containining protein
MLGGEMGQYILEKKLKEIRIRVDKFSDDDVEKFVERYPLLKKYYSKLNSIKGNCKKCGHCCVGGICLSEVEIKAIRSLIPEINDFVEIFARKDLITGKIIEYLVTKLTKYGYCIFIAKDGLCVIHKIRPILCRVFPFFPKEKGTCRKNVKFKGLSVKEGTQIWKDHFLEIQQSTEKTLNLLSTS